MMNVTLKSMVGVFLGIILASYAIEYHEKHETRKAMNAELEQNIIKFYEQFKD